MAYGSFFKRCKFSNRPIAGAARQVAMARSIEDTQQTLQSRRHTQIPNNRAKARGRSQEVTPNRYLNQMRRTKPQNTDGPCVAITILLNPAQPYQETTDEVPPSPPADRQRPRGRSPIRSTRWISAFQACSKIELCSGRLFGGRQGSIGGFFFFREVFLFLAVVSRRQPNLNVKGTVMEVELGLMIPSSPDLIRLAGYLINFYIRIQILQIPNIQQSHLLSLVHQCSHRQQTSEQKSILNPSLLPYVRSEIPGTVKAGR